MAPDLKNSLLRLPILFQKLLTLHFLHSLQINTLKVETYFGFCHGSVCYNSRHNLIIACPLDGTIHFYDVDTLWPAKERETQNLDGSITNMSFHPETDTYIMGCTEGYTYSYNASSHELKQLKKCEDQVLTITFVDSTHYVFSSLESKKLGLGALGSENIMSFDSHNSDVFCLQNLPQRNLLLAGLIDGSVIIYRTDKLPHLQVFGSIQAHQAGMLVFTAQRIVINGKEYVITAGQERAVKIWHLVKGKLRLLRVIWTEEIPYSVVYLENYRMIAIASECNYVKFLRLPFGKVESRINLSKDDKYNKHSLFLMREKNMIGVTSLPDPLMEFIQVGGVKRNC